jgi:hypothetical protein
MAKRGQPQFQPTDRQRGQVEAMARYGIPEGGITPGLAVVANAILDALAPLGRWASSKSTCRRPLSASGARYEKPRKPRDRSSAS